MSRFSDTIAALATPVGTSGIAVMRVSGPLCRSLAQNLLGREPAARVAAHTDYRDLSGHTLDDVLATLFVGPHSYTAEDSLEISCHGNPLIAQKILEDLFARGCRPAEPGEFTRRAFLNSKIDLSQAEGVIDLIHARSDRALAAANQQLRGSLGRHLSALSDELLQLLARIEAYIDFPDEDLPPEDLELVRSGLERVATGTGRLLATQHYGEILRDGIKTVILGEPNAGKSSLLNRLVGRERALVSPEPGTTRDFIEERILLGPHCLRLIDTAGLNPAPAPLERLGMEKTYERAAEADLILLVFDASRPFPALPNRLNEVLASTATLRVLNKSDLPRHSSLGAEITDKKRFINISATTGAGLDQLTAEIVSQAETFRQDHGAEIIAINARHAEALKRAQCCLTSALARLPHPGSVELLASEVRGALDAFGEIGGRIDNERMLDHLFATFCIGK